MMKRISIEYIAGIILLIILAIVYCGGHLDISVILAYKKYIILLPALLTFVLEIFGLLNKIEDVERRTKYIHYTFVFILLATLGLIYASFILGNKIFVFADIGSDTVQQYVPYYTSCVERIREGSFQLWNWNYGLGTSVLNNMSQTLDPFGLFTILGGVVFGTDAIVHVLIWSQMLKVICAYFICRYYLHMFRLGEWSVCIGAYLYAFNAFIMLWGQHYMLGTGSIYILLILIGIEKILKSKELGASIYLALAVAASIIYSYYISYMILLFAAMYFMVRICNPEHNIKLLDRIKQMFRCLYLVVSGVLIGCITLIPATNFLTVNSSRLDSDVSAISLFIEKLLSLPVKETIVQILSRIISNNLLYINQICYGSDNYYEMHQLSCSIFGFVFIGQYLAYIWKNKKNKIYYGLIIILAILLVFNPGFTLAFNGFSVVVYRYTFVLLPVFVLLIAYVFENCILNKKINMIMLVLSAIFSCLIFLITYRNAALEVKTINAMLCFLFILGVLALCWYKFRSGLDNYGIRIFIAVLVLSCIVDNGVTANIRNLASDDFTGTNKTREAIAYLEAIDDSFYRVEKNYYDWSMFSEPMMDGRSAYCYYNSTANRNLIDFYEKFTPHATINGTIYLYSLLAESDLPVLRIINSKYILSHSELSYTWCELVTIMDGIYIYRNTHASSVAQWYTKTISEEDYEKIEDANKKQLLYDTVILEHENTVTYESCEAIIGKFYLENDVKMIGEVECDGTGILMISIPDEEGWSIYVDNELTETMNADYGFIGIELDAGKHQIEARYTLPKLKEGFIVSLVGWCMLGTWIMFSKKYQKRELV